MGGVDRSGAGEPDVRSEVRSVVVHAAGAVCTRRARVLVPRDGAGEVTVRIGGLPPTLYERSLRGRVLGGPAGTRVTDLRLDVSARVHRGQDVPALRMDVEDAEDRQAALRDRKERLEAEIAQVAGLRAEPLQPRRGDPPRWAPVESLLALAGFVDSRLALLHERLRTTEDLLADADHEVDVLRARLYEASTAAGTGRAEPTVTAVVTLALGGPRERRPGEGANAPEPATGSVAAGSEVTGTTGSGPKAAGSGSAGSGATDTSAPGATSGATDTSAPGTPAGTATTGDAATGGPTAGDAATPADGRVPVDIDVEYQVPGASWVPTYQLRLDGGGGSGTLVLRACVAQRTGEDWSGVRLGLSTADLLRRADLPELRSLRIGRRQQEPAAAGWREPPAGLADLFADYDGAVAARPGIADRLGAAPAAYPRAAAPAPSPAADVAASFAGAAPPYESDGESASYGGLFGAPPPPAPGGGGAPLPVAAAPAAPGGPPPGAEPAPRFAPRRSGSAPGAAPGTGAPDGTPSAPHSPSADLLDYARLTIAGPDAPEGRGTLRPADAGTGPVLTGYRRGAGAAQAPARPAHTVDVRASAGSFDYRFDAAAPVDVASDGRWHVVPVEEVPVVTESRYVCVPSVDTAVFGTVLLTNTSAHPLLAGPADVMVDGDFVLTAALPTIAPGGREAVGIGVAESVQVARRAYTRESAAGLRGGTTVLDRTVEVEVANRLPYPVVVEVRERIPVSAEKDVRVEEHQARPPWQAADEPLDGRDGMYVRGARLWRVELEPGRTTTLTGGYEVRFPAGKSAVGGNRRG
ncbi:DUF4139 domain-containing protein [Streptomyces sp. HPF1205]|uniref:DUF4139 domain-containing protein n=1 Tax=Streptomyces sp. HPF1205 TaxID=2873262 RepID=UPI001CEC2E54|nr:DUF4139 domain-containing protein [Streptomyces sp. HPF1205]